MPEALHTYNVVGNMNEHQVSHGQGIVIVIIIIIIISISLPR